MTDLRYLLSELRRRRVWRVAAGYAVVAWVAIEVTDTIFPRLYLPEWTVTAVIVGALGGFPVALVLAWYFDLVADAGDGRRPRGTVLVGASVAGASLALAAVVGVLVWPSPAAVERAEPGSVSRGEAAASLVVLPFSMLEPGADDEYLADGMTEELIAALGRLRELQVVGSTTSFALKGYQGEARQIGDSLGVGAAVAGTVRRSGQRLRVSAQLVDTGSGYRIWGETYDREVADVLTVQEEIARSIAAALDLHIPRGLTVFGVSTRSLDPQAYDLYLQGRHAWRRRTAEGLELALDYFRGALQGDSAFAPALVGLGDTYRNLAGYGYRAGYENELDLAESAISRALALNPELADAHAAWGFQLALAGSPRELSLASLDRAIELNPSYASAYHWRGLVLTELGRIEEGLADYRRARALDPLSPAIHGASARTLMLAGDLARAEELARRGIELAPELMAMHMMLSKVHELEARPLQALAAARRAEELAPGNPHALGQLARAQVALSDTGGAREIVARLESASHPCAACLAEVYAALGNDVGLFRWLDAGLWSNLGGFYMPKTDPAYEAFRGDPRFARFLVEEGLAAASP